MELERLLLLLENTDQKALDAYLEGLHGDITLKRVQLRFLLENSVKLLTY